ncbi:MAG: Hint domain-containing protein [Halocynthiibacter sp.]
MAFLSFIGTRVGASNSFNDDGGGTHIELDQSRDLDGNGNPYYMATDIILIEIDDADIGPNGELLEGGADGKATILSFKINGVEQLSTPDSIKMGGGSISEMGDGYFFIEGLKLAILAPKLDTTFEDADLDSGKLILDIEDRVDDFDLNDNGDIDVGTAEEGDGIFNIHTATIVCFAKGTLIHTPQGGIPVEDLEAQDLVETLDNGPQPILAIATRKLDFRVDDPRHQPIEIKKDCFGAGLPRRALCVSPQHRILIASTKNNTGGTLVAAKGLLHIPGIRQKAGCRNVEYFHIIFAHHEIIFSEGLPTESLYAGPLALEALDHITKEKMRPHLEAQNSKTRVHMAPARPFIRPKKAAEVFRNLNDITAP